MTNDEAAMLLDGGNVSEPAPAGNSEPTPAADVNKEAPATVAGDSEPKKDTVKTDEAKPAGTETAGDKQKQDSKKKNFYSQERAQHEFSRQNKRLKSLQAENKELREKLEKYEGTTKESFIDKVSGELDTAKYAEFMADKRSTELMADRVEREAKELEEEQDEIAWRDRVERELGEESDNFHAYCEEVVDEESGKTRFGAFLDWLEKKDPRQTIISRINASKTGVRLLQKMMSDKEARMSVVHAETPHKMELALDRIEEGFVSAKAPTEKKATFAETWKARPKENKPENKPKPTGSAFSGETKSAGKIVRDNNYFASLL